MSIIDALAKAVKDGAHSFVHIRKTTGLRLTDHEFLKLIKENGQRLRFTRIRRVDADGNHVQPGWPGVKLRPDTAT